MATSVMRLPPLYESADAASLKGQRTYLWLLRAQIAFPLVAAAAAIVLSGKESGLLLAALFVLGLSASVYMQLRRPEREWFDGRVLAESMKTIAWRFAMKVPPYNGGLSQTEAELQLNKRVADLIVERKEMTARIAAKGAGAQVTDSMKALRDLTWNARRPIYVRERLDDQLNWYRDKAGVNDGMAGRWMSLVSLLQLIGLLLALLRAANVIEVNLFGLVGAAIGAALGWLQAKRHQDLARSYSFAAFELGLIRGRADAATSESEFVRFVEDAEEAMSREHTAWHAKRLQ